MQLEPEDRGSFHSIIYRQQIRWGKPHETMSPGSIDYVGDEVNGLQVGNEPNLRKVIDTWTVKSDK